MYSERFERLWKIYPNEKGIGMRGNKKRAFAQYKKVQNKISFAEMGYAILAQVAERKAHKENSEKPENKFVKTDFLPCMQHAERWFRDYGWENDVEKKFYNQVRGIEEPKPKTAEQRIRKPVEYVEEKLSEEELAERKRKRLEREARWEAQGILPPKHIRQRSRRLLQAEKDRRKMDFCDRIQSETKNK